MAVIPKSLGAGGAHLSPNGSTGEPSLLEILNGVADDLASRSGITSPDATDLPTAITLVNEIKAALNVAVTTTKEA